MYETPTGQRAAELVAAIHGWVSELQDCDWTSCDGDELLELLRDLEAAKRRLATIDHGLLGDVDARGLAFERGCVTTSGLLRQLLRISAREASGRVAAAGELGSRTSLTGEVAPPVFGAVAAAQATGDISAAQAHLITSTVSKLPIAIQAEHDVAVETFLVKQARELPPEQLAMLARRVTDTLNPDGKYTEEAERERLRGIDVHKRSDGSARLVAELTAPCAEVILTVFDATARPRPAEEGTPDPRSAAQRRHDGLQDALLTVLRCGAVPQSGGVATTVLLSITDEQLYEHTAARNTASQDAAMPDATIPDAVTPVRHSATGASRGSPSGLVRTGHGSLISLEQALNLATDARVIPIIFNRAKRVVAYGSSHRIFTETQRLAMIGRDQGCSFPGCDVPPLWCQSHHVVDYALGGATSVDNGTLLCGPHHRDHARLGWRCEMTDGVPLWTPPAWLDPEQQPRRNCAHQPEFELNPVDALRDAERGQSPQPTRHQRAEHQPTQREPTHQRQIPGQPTGPMSPPEEPSHTARIRKPDRGQLAQSLTARPGPVSQPASGPTGNLVASDPS